MHIISMWSNAAAIKLSGSVPAGYDGGSCSEAGFRYILLLTFKAVHACYVGNNRAFGCRRVTFPVFKAVIKRQVTELRVIQIYPKALHICGLKLKTSRNEILKFIAKNH